MASSACRAALTLKHSIHERPKGITAHLEVLNRGVFFLGVGQTIC